VKIPAGVQKWAPLGLLLFQRERELPPLASAMTTICDFPAFQSQDGNQSVCYYPVKTIYGDISKEWCFRFVSYQGCNATSKKFLNRVEKTLDIRDRINAGYLVIGDNGNFPQLGNPFNGAV
jgi:hypothetical protein